MRFRSDRLLLLITFLLLPLLAGATAAQPVATDDAQRVASELESLRREVADLHRLYRERIDVLESRVAALEGTGPAPTEVPQPARAELVVPEGAAGVGGPQGTLPLYGNVSAMSKIFNPDIAVIGSFIGVAGKNPVESVPAFEMKEVETSLQAVVDPYARADFFLSVSPEGIEVEEGYVTFPTLPGGIYFSGEVNLESVGLSGSDRRGVQRHVRGISEYASAGPQLRGASPRIPGFHGFIERRTGRVIRLWSQRRRAVRDDEDSWLRRDVSISTPAEVYLPGTAGANRAGVEPANRARRSDRLWGLRRSRVSVLAAVVRWRPLRPCGTSAGSGRPRHRHVLVAHLLAERVQPDTGAVSSDEVC